MTIFETDRLLVRRINPVDIKALLEIYNNAENMRYISSGKSQWTHAELTEKYGQNNKDNQRGIGIFALVLKSKQTVIGEAGLFNSFNNPKKLELGYIIDSTYWNKGLGQEICKGLINYAFFTLRINTLIARMYTENNASINLAEKCGMIKIDEGNAKNGKSYLVYCITNP